MSNTSATTQEYIAYVANSSTAFPPPGIQATSADSYVTWARAFAALKGSSGGWTLSLSAPAWTYQQETVTATANGDVGSTLYYIEIFDEATGRMIGDCGSGTSCSVLYSPGNSDLVAFVSDCSTTLPPAGAVAASNVVPTTLVIP